jgi:hypothetical protein
MSKVHFEWNPHRVWLALFGAWLVLLSGILTPWIGGPGIIQWWRLESLLSQRQERLSEVENQVLALSSEQVRLERSVATQQREIRRVLGYVRADEMVFDFSAELPVRRTAPRGEPPGAPSTTVARR